MTGWWIMKFKVSKTTRGYGIKVLTCTSPFNLSGGSYTTLRWLYLKGARVLCESGNEVYCETKEGALSIIKQYIKENVTILVEGIEEIEL